MWAFLLSVIRCTTCTNWERVYLSWCNFTAVWFLNYAQKEKYHVRLCSGPCSQFLIQPLPHLTHWQYVLFTRVTDGEISCISEWLSMDEHLMYNCGTRIGFHIPSKHAFFKHNPEKGGNTEVHLHPCGTHIICICKNILLSQLWSCWQSNSFIHSPVLLSAMDCDKLSWGYISSLKWNDCHKEEL